jgi:hypothetical protein
MRSRPQRNTSGVRDDSTPKEVTKEQKKVARWNQRYGRATTPRALANVEFDRARSMIAGLPEHMRDRQWTNLAAKLAGFVRDLPNVADSEIHSSQFTRGE